MFQVRAHLAVLSKGPLNRSSLYKITIDFVPCISMCILLAINYSGYWVPDAVLGFCAERCIWQCCSMLCCVFLICRKSLEYWGSSKQTTVLTCSIRHITKHFMPACLVVLIFVMQMVICKLLICNSSHLACTGCAKKPGLVWSAMTLLIFGADTF